MIITRKPGESDQDFRARAFAAAREHCCDVANHLNSDQIGLTQGYRYTPAMDARPRHKWPQATPMTSDEFRAARTVTELTEPPRMSRLRAIWYTCGLVAASAVVAMAVFGMGS